MKTREKGRWKKATADMMSEGAENDDVSSICHLYMDIPLAKNPLSDQSDLCVCGHACICSCMYMGVHERDKNTCIFTAVNHYPKGLHGE